MVGLGNAMFKRSGGYGSDRLGGSELCKVVSNQVGRYGLGQIVHLLYWVVVHNEDSSLY